MNKLLFVAGEDIKTGDYLTLKEFGNCHLIVKASTEDTDEPEVT